MIDPTEVSDAPARQTLAGDKKGKKREGKQASPKKEKFSLPGPALEGSSTSFHQLGFCLTGRSSMYSAKETSLSRHCYPDIRAGSQQGFLDIEETLPITRIESAPHIAEGASPCSSSRGESPSTEPSVDSDYSNTDDWPEDGSPEFLRLPETLIEPDVNWGRLGSDSGSVMGYLRLENARATFVT